MTNEPERKEAQAGADQLRRIIYFGPLALFVALAGLLFWGLDPGRDPRFVPTAMLDDPIPDFDYPAVEGLESPGFASANLKAGEVRVINFFASWCVPCKIEHPLLMDLAAKKISVYGVSHRDNPPDAKAFLDKLGNPYERIGSDPGRGAVHWGVYGLPETFVVDGEGRIRFHHRGPLTATQMEQEILPLIEALQ